MKYLFEIAARTTMGDPAENKHQRLMSGLEKVVEPWGIKGRNGNITMPTFNGEIIAVCKLNNVLGKGLKGEVIYRYRNLLIDDSSNDDHISIEFNPMKIDYKVLITEVFSEYIYLFNAYSASVFNEDLIFEDFQKTRNKNFRDTIIRFYPVCFFDEELCQRALRLSPNEVANRLSGHVEKVELFGNGVIIISGFHPLSNEQANEFDLKIHSLLR